MIKIVCDRCGAEIKPGKIGYVALNFRETPGGEFAAENLFEDSHFCPTCMERITGFIINPERDGKAEGATKGESVSADAPEQPAKEEPDNADAPAKFTRKPAQKRIDHGKIMALRNAGWNNAKIADEMGMTPGAVATAASAYSSRAEYGAVPR